MIESAWKAVGAWIQLKPIRSLLLIVGGTLLIVFWGFTESRRADQNNGHANALCENLNLIDVRNIEASGTALDGYEAMRSICRSRSHSIVVVIHK